VVILYVAKTNRPAVIFGVLKTLNKQQNNWSKDGRNDRSVVCVHGRVLPLWSLLCISTPSSLISISNRI
jgi:hypothetical protein